MWLIPTRNRPEYIKELIRCFANTDCKANVAVMVDDCKDQYASVYWPEKWHVHYSDEHLEMGGALNALFRLYPHEKTYGIITDHGRPVTPLWAQRMESAAQDWNIVLCDDQHNRINPRTGSRRITSASCYGGELVRSLGWVWCDLMVHMYADDVWEDIGAGLNNVKICDDVLVHDLLFSRGQMPLDHNHKRLFRGEPYVGKDQQAYEKHWLPMKDIIIADILIKMKKSDK